MRSRSKGPAREALVVAILALSALAASCSPKDTESPTGPDDGEPTASPRLLQTFLPGSIGFYYDPPTLVGDAVYIGTSRGVEYTPGASNAFYKLSETLAKVWEFPLGNREVRGGATLDGAGNIYFAVEEGRLRGTSNPSVLWLYSLDPNGLLRWTRMIRRVLPMYGMDNPAIATDNTIYIGGDKLYAFDANGTIRWSYASSPASMLILNAPIIDPEGNLYFSSLNWIVSLTPSGSERWIVTTRGEYFSSPAFSTDYSKVFVAVEDTVYSLQTSNGSRVWAFSPPGMVGVFRATPAVDDADNVYLGTKADTSSVFYAIRSDGAGLRWQNPIRADLYSSPAIGTDRTLYVGAEGAKLYALDLDTGVEKWSATLLADVTWSSPAISSNGTLYIGSMDVEGTGAGLYAFRTDAAGLLHGAGSPRFHAGNANTGRRP